MHSSKCVYNAEIEHTASGVEAKHMHDPNAHRPNKLAVTVHALYVVHECISLAQLMGTDSYSCGVCWPILGWKLADACASTGQQP